MKRGQRDNSSSDASASDDSDVGIIEETVFAKFFDRPAVADAKRNLKKPALSVKPSTSLQNRVQTPANRKAAQQMVPSTPVVKNKSDPRKKTDPKFPLLVGKKTGSKQPSDQSKKSRIDLARKFKEALERTPQDPPEDQAALSMRYACLAEGSLAKDNPPYRYTKQEYFAENGARQDDKTSHKRGAPDDSPDRNEAPNETFLFNPEAMMYFTEADLKDESRLERIIDKYFETSQVSPTLLTRTKKDDNKAANESQDTVSAGQGE